MEGELGWLRIDNTPVPAQDLAGDLVHAHDPAGHIQGQGKCLMLV